MRALNGSLRLSGKCRNCKNEDKRLLRRKKRKADIQAVSGAESRLQAQQDEIGPKQTTVTTDATSGVPF
jgi:hypothetical protein